MHAYYCLSSIQCTVKVPKYVNENMLICWSRLVFRCSCLICDFWSSVCGFNVSTLCVFRFSSLNVIWSDSSLSFCLNYELIRKRIRGIHYCNIDYLFDHKINYNKVSTGFSNFLSMLWIHLAIQFWKRNVNNNSYI